MILHALTRVLDHKKSCPMHRMRKDNSTTRPPLSKVGDKEIGVKSKEIVSLVPSLSMVAKPES